MTAAAIRQRAHRERVRSGKVLITVEVDEVAVAEMLRGSGLLDQRTDDARDIARALERQVQILCDLHRLTEA